MKDNQKILGEPQILITSQSLVASIGDRKKTFSKESGDYRIAQQHVLNEDWQGLYDLMDKKVAAEAIGLKIQDETAYNQKGEKAHPTLESRLHEGYPKEHLLAFRKRCEANPLKKAVHDLLCFLKDRTLPLTPKGTFLAWKSIKKNYTDHHTGKFDNHPGEKPKMDRNACSENREQACSTGFHAGTWGYASTFNSSSRMMVVEVDPANVTSVPLDHNEQKLRCCQYLVLAELLPGKKPQEFINSLAKRANAQDPEEFAEKVKPSAEKKTKELPSKRQIMDYISQLKKSKKGNGYIAKMLKNKFEQGIELLTQIASDPKNPQRINATIRELYQDILKNAAES